MFDAVDNRGFIEFSDWVYALGSYCFFGKQDIIKYMYINLDKKLDGYVSFKEFREFMYSMNPYTNKQRVWRAMKQMNYKV